MEKATTLTSLQTVFLPASFLSCLTLFCITLHWRHQVSLKQEGVSNRDHKLPWQPPSSGLRLYPQLQITHTHDKSSAGLRLNPQDRNLSQGWGCTCEYRSHTPHDNNLPQGWGCTHQYRSHSLVMVFCRGEAAQVSTDHTHTHPRQQSSVAVGLHPQVQVLRPHALVMVFCRGEVVLEQAKCFIASRLLLLGEDFSRRVSNTLIRWIKANGETC